MLVLLIELALNFPTGLLNLKYITNNEFIDKQINSLISIYK